MSKQILIVTGEASGDYHAAQVVVELRKELRGDWHFWGTGGEELKMQGVEVLSHVRDLAAIGPSAALGKLLSYWLLFRKIVRRLKQERPALVLLVDFPEFNLRLARRAKRLGLPVLYFISPQLWAWRKGRVREVRQSVDRMLVIFPFEEDFYRARGVQATFVTHPFAARRWRPRVDRARLGLSEMGRVLCLLPGSRAAEVSRIFPEMLGALRLLADEMDFEAVVVRASSIEARRLERVIEQYPDLRPRIRVVEGDAQDYLASCDFALVKSGTSTLLATLAGAPFVAIYRVSAWSWWIGRVLIDTPYYCISNLVAGRLVVPELMQGDATAKKIAAVAARFLREPERSHKMRDELRRVAERLGDGRAYQRTARIVCEMVDVAGKQLTADGLIG